MDNTVLVAPVSTVYTICMFSILPFMYAPLHVGTVALSVTFVHGIDPSFSDWPVLFRLPVGLLRSPHEV